MDEEDKINERLYKLEHQVGITKDGVKTGNGLLNRVEKVEAEMNKMHDKIDTISDEQKHISAECNNLAKSVRELSGLINDVKNELKDNISFRSVSKLKNMLIGIAAVIVAITTIIGFLKNILN